MRRNQVAVVGAAETTELGVIPNVSQIQLHADAALNASGAQGLVINIGGDLVIQGDWEETVDISDPKSDVENGVPIARLVVRDRAVATSGDYRRGVEIGGRHYSHIVDPRTGMPADQIISSTVIARSPAEAGALATALSVLTPEESSRLVASMPGVEYLLVKKNGERIVSNGWSAFEATPAAHAAALRPAAAYEQVTARSSASPWDPKYELTVTIELSLIEGYRVHRPYVAVWIEDEEHAPVRTIALWFARPMPCGFIRPILSSVAPWRGTARWPKPSKLSDLKR